MDRHRVQDQWTRQADAYTTSPLHRGTPDLEIMVGMAEPKPSDVVLDLATGGGHTGRAFAHHVATVVAFDITRRMLENARGLAEEERLPNVLFVQGDVTALPFGPSTFDLVTVRAATHHFPDLPSALAEVKRVLRPEGRFVVNDSVVPGDPTVDRFVNEAEVLRDPTHVKSYSVSEWEVHLRAAGLRLLAKESWRKFHDFQFWMELAGMEGKDKKRLEEAYLSAPREVRESLRVEVRGGRVVGFADEKGIFLARRG